MQMSSFSHHYDKISESFVTEEAEQGDTGTQLLFCPGLVIFGNTSTDTTRDVAPRRVFNSVKLPVEITVILHKTSCYCYD